MFGKMRCLGLRRALVAFGAAVVLIAAAAVQDLSPVDTQQIQRFGALLPRPVDGEARDAAGFPPPRPADEVLAEIDSATATMREIAATDAEYESRFTEYRALQRARHNLISELEESGYDGPRLESLLATKLDDLSAEAANAWWALNQVRAARDEIAARHPDSDLAPATRAADALDTIHLMTQSGFRVHPDDYERLAAMELARRDHEEAGIVILEALHNARNEALQKKWHDWIVANLPATSLAHRFVARERGFGSPIRLAGEGLDGQPIDTAEWKGDVIIVDFWGLWCVPCIEAMPELNRVYSAHKDKGLRVLGILCDHEFDRARTFLAEKGYDWPQLIDPTTTPETMTDHFIAKQYAVGGFPTMWIIDRNGILREQVWTNLEETVLKYLDEE